MESKKYTERFWVHAGHKYDADIYIDLNTGEKKHIGTKLTSNDPEIYSGEPSFTGFLTGRVIKKILRKI